LRRFAVEAAVQARSVGACAAGRRGARGPPRTPPGRGRGSRGCALAPAAPAAAVPGRGHVGRRVGGRWGFTGDRWAAVSAGSRHPAREWARALARLAPFNLFGAPFQ